MRITHSNKAAHDRNRVLGVVLMYWSQNSTLEALFQRGSERIALKAAFPLGPRNSH